MCTEKNYNHKSNRQIHFLYYAEKCRITSNGNCKITRIPNCKTRRNYKLKQAKIIKYIFLCL